MRVVSKNQVFRDSQKKQTSFYEVHELPVPHTNVTKIWDDNLELDIGGDSVPFGPPINTAKILGCCAGFGAGSLGVANEGYCHQWLNGYCINQIPDSGVMAAIKTIYPNWDNRFTMDPRHSDNYHISMLQVRGTIVLPFNPMMDIINVPELASPEFDTRGLEAERILHLTITQFTHNFNKDPLYVPLNVFDFMNVSYAPGFPYVFNGQGMQIPQTADIIKVHKHLIFKIDATGNVEVNAENIAAVPACEFFSRAVQNIKCLRIPFEFFVPLDMDCSLDPSDANTGKYYHERKNTLWMHAYLEDPIANNTLYTDSNPAGWADQTPKIWHRTRLFYEDK